MAHSRDLVVVAVALIGAGIVAGTVAARISGGGVKPLSDCEANCIKEFPDDTQARLNCMLKCVADGNVAIQRVLAIQ